MLHLFMKVQDLRRKESDLASHPFTFFFVHIYLSKARPLILVAL